VCLCVCLIFISLIFSTVAAIAGADFVVIGGDTRMSMMEVCPISRDTDKICILYVLLQFMKLFLDSRIFLIEFYFISATTMSHLQQPHSMVTYCKCVV
jgi:hypothetical protein